MKKSISIIISVIMSLSFVTAFAGDINDTYNTDIPDSIWQAMVDTQSQVGGIITLYDRYCVMRADSGTYFNITNPTEGNSTGDENDTYLMLTPKEDSAEEPLSSLSNFQILSTYGNTNGGSSGHLYFSMKFKVNNLRTVDSTGTRILMARLGFSPVWNYSLKVGTLSDDQTIVYNGETVKCVNVGLGSNDTDNMTTQTGKNAWVPRGVWCKYYVDVNFYTKTCTVGVINLETDENIFDPYVVNIDTGKYTYSNNEVTVRVVRDAGEICIDDMVNTQDIYVYEEESKIIAVENNEITASIKMGNDISTGAYNPAYTSKPPVLVLVAYDDENRMLDMKTLNTNLQRTKTSPSAATLNEVSISMPVPKDFSYATAMVWNCQGNMSSLCDSWSTR